MTPARIPIADKMREVAATMGVEAGRHKSVVDPAKKFLKKPSVKPPRRKPFSGYDRAENSEYMANYRMEHGGSPKPAKKKKRKLKPVTAVQPL